VAEPTRILVIDDEEEVCEAVARRLARDGYTVTAATTEQGALEMIDQADPPYQVVVTDMVMDSPRSGMNVLEAAVVRDVFTEVIVLTAYGNVANAVECMKAGAFDYVEKNTPGVDVYEVLSIKVKRAIQNRRSLIREFQARAQRGRRETAHEL
jgi:DNA-binding NtrC family response regulator